MPVDLASALEVAAALARRAAAEVLRIEREGVTRDRKADRSIVTNADHASDRILRDGLRAAFPSIPILTEESGLEGDAAAGTFWAVDPLDGTRAFARGEEGFAVMLGLVEGNRPVLGAVLDPRRDALYLAAEGCGAWIEETGRPRRRLAPAPHSGPPRLVVTTSMPEAESARLAAALGASDVRKIHSVGVKIALLAAGAYDVYVNTHAVAVWDLAAPAAILAAAGGTYSDLEGRPLPFPPTSEKVRGGTLATIGRDHAAILAAVRSALDAAPPGR